MHIIFEYNQYEKKKSFKYLRNKQIILHVCFVTELNKMHMTKLLQRFK